MPFSVVIVLLISANFCKGASTIRKSQKGQFQYLPRSISISRKDEPEQLST